MKAIHLLQKHWQHQQFRPLQEQIINTVIEKNDVLAILPTGGGKSICYQIPALILEGTCVVISPLKALIEDQINALENKDIKSISIPSPSNQEDIIRIFDNIKHQNIKLLYLSPERFMQPLVQEKLKQANISFFAIDEAHCIAQWGHDFRPSYLSLQYIKTNFDKPIIALTATATPKTQQEIVGTLQLKNPIIHIGDYARENLIFTQYQSPNKYDLLLRMLHKIKGSSIIYLQNRLGTQELSQRLIQSGFKSTFFHAQLNDKQKQTHLNNWHSGKTPIMVATNAFGMGIDKGDVRLVVHLEIPENLEHYIQEAGRAGRDGMKSFSSVLLANNDFEKYKKHQSQHQDLIENVTNTYIKLNQYLQVAYGETPETVFDIDIDDFVQRYHFKYAVAFQALQLLSTYQIIQFNQNKGDLQHEVKVITSSQQTFAFLQQETKHQTTLDYILRYYTGVFDLSQKINIAKIATATQQNAKEVYQQLEELHQLDIIDFKARKNNFTLQYLLPREDKKTIQHIRKNLKNLMLTKQEQAQKTWDYFKNTTVCRSQMILDYFTSNDSKPCGICDICLHQKNDLATNHAKVLTTVKQKPQAYNDLLVLLGGNHQHLNRILEELLNNKQIIYKALYYQIV